VTEPRQDPPPAETAERPPLEWVTFGVAVAVILAVVGLIAIEIPQSERPPAPVAEAGIPVERDERFVVPVVVENRGESTAENVQVLATLTIDGEDHEGDQVIDFLSGGEREDLEFVFDDDPGEGELEVRVTGYARPGN
jgi:uncharacterized protein (TIGR02588 family)